MPFTRDDAKVIGDVLGIPRLGRMGANWEQQADELEQLIALASWRSQTVEFRARALIEALDATRDPPPVYKPWGSDAP